MREQAVKVGLFLLVWFSCAWFGSWEGNPNNAVRLFAAVSLVEQGDATIDEFAELTIDKARFGEHFYSDKAPGMTLMALPAVALMHVATGEQSTGLPKHWGSAALWRFMAARQWLAVATGPALLTALAAVLLFDLSVGATGSGGAGLVAALAYALGSPIWGWSTTLFGHAAVAALFVVALWAVWRGTDGETRPGLAAVAGAALGWAVVVEHQAVIAGAAVAVWALLRVWRRPERWRLVGLAVAGGAAAMVPFLLYNLVAFGTVFRLGYQGVVGWEGMSQGLFGLTRPSGRVLWEVLFGSRRGLFWVAPVLMMGVFGLVELAERRAARGLAVTAAAVALIALLVNASYFYWDGGNSTGPRHAMPAAGTLSLGVGALWASLGRRWERGSLLAVLGVSVALNLVIASADVMAPPEFAWPVKEIVWDQRFSQGQLRTFPSEFLGWSVWAGLGMYVAVALPVLAWLAVRCSREDG